MCMRKHFRDSRPAVVTIKTSLERTWPGCVPGDHSLPDSSLSDWLSQPNVSPMCSTQRAPRCLAVIQPQHSSSAGQSTGSTLPQEDTKYTSLRGHVGTGSLSSLVRTVLNDLEVEMSTDSNVDCSDFVPPVHSSPPSTGYNCLQSPVMTAPSRPASCHETVTRAQCNAVRCIFLSLLCNQILF